MGEVAGRQGSGPEGFPGDREARQELERLFRQQNATLIGMLLARLRDRESAEDVAQEAYARLFQLDKQGTISYLKAYLFQTALNIASDRLRQRVRRTRDEHLVAVHAEEGDAPSAEAVCIQAQDWARLTKAVEQLPLQCRKAFTLVEFEGFSAKEAAAQMQVQQNTVYVLVKRAYEHLMKSLEGSERPRGADHA